MKKFILLMSFCLLFTVSADAKIVPIDSSHFGLTSSKNFSAADDENLPVSYDLRNYGVVPPIRDQSPWGTCWAQAATASVETNYLKQIADGTINPVASLGETSNDVEISAIHLSYYYVASPLRQQNFTAHDKIVTPNKIAKYPNAVNAFNNGGSVSHIITVWSRGYGWGPVADSEIPYHDFDNVTVNSKDVLEASPDVYTSVLRLTEAEYFNSEISADLMFSSENRNALKKLIMEKGAFSIAYNAVDDEKSFLNTTTGAYFYPLNAKSNANTDTPADKTNHLIAVIGWDDNFAIENFNNVARPSKPGAWLARNSWNTNWPSDELGGYFWISYEQILYHGTAFVVEPANKNLRTYYHDDLGWCSSWGDDDTTGKAAAVFQSKGNETIKEVGFYTTENGANVTVSIYKYDENPAVGRVIYDIQDGGALEAEQTEYYDLAGYHTMKLDSPVNISENEYFAAVLTAVNPSYKYPLAIESRLNGYSDYAMVFDGENYFYSSDDDVWVNGASLTQVSNDVTIAVPANVCIKVFAECSDDVTVEYESPVGKSINGIAIGTPSGEPTYSEDAFNELNEKSVTEGREFSQILVDNDGNILSEDLTVGLTLIYVEEFEEETPGEVSQYGLKDIPQEIDPLYPAGFEPDAYMYLSQEDGFIYPTYNCYAITDENGRITINADKMKSLNPIKNEIQLPDGHYLGYYVPLTSPDFEPVGVIGMVKPFEITAAEDDDDEQNNNNFSRSSSGSCNLGIASGLIILLSAAIILKRK